MLISTKSSAAAKTLPEESPLGEAPPDADALEAVLMQIAEPTFGSDEVEPEDTERFLVVDPSESIEEDALRYVPLSKLESSSPEEYVHLKKVREHPTLKVPLDALGPRQFSGFKRTSESPDKRSVALSSGSKLRYRRTLGAADFLSALSEAQQAVRRAKGPKPTPADRVKFNALARRWVREAEGISVHSRAVMHKAYQQIIGMGPVAIPLLLEALEDQPDHWMWALSILANEDPAKHARTFQQARAEWLKWGHRKGYISGG